MALNYARVRLAVAPAGKDSASVCATSLALRRDETRRSSIETSGKHLRTRLGFRRIRERGRVSYSATRREERRLTGKEEIHDVRTPPDEVARNFRVPRESRILSRRHSLSLPQLSVCDDFISENWKYFPLKLVSKSQLAIAGCFITRVSSRIKEKDVPRDATVLNNLSLRT